MKDQHRNFRLRISTLTVIVAIMFNIGNIHAGDTTETTGGFETLGSGDVCCGWE